MTDQSKDLQFSLLKLTTKVDENVYKMLQEIPKEENGFRNMFAKLSLEEFQEELVTREKESRGEDLPDYKVPQSIYWFYVDENPVGMVKLRHFLNDSLRENGGHIGYALTPRFRGKGYANKMLELALLEAKNLGINKVLLICEANNTASKAVIVNNGGALEKETENDAFYWVEV